MDWLWIGLAMDWIGYGLDWFGYQKLQAHFLKY